MLAYTVLPGLPVHLAKHLHVRVRRVAVARTRRGGADCSCPSKCIPVLDANCASVLAMQPEKSGHVRKLVGYERYDTEAAVAALNTVYAELRLFQNLFLPTVKLVRKERVGARTRRRYDTAQTPLDRVRACPEADRAKGAALVALRDRLDPFVLASRIDRLLERVYTLAHHRTVPGSGAQPVDGARPVDAPSAPTRSLDARQKRGRPHRQPASSSTPSPVTGLMAR